MTQLLEALIERMARTGVAHSGELHGCSAVEIEELEHAYDVRLPATYRGYLAFMGHGSCRLFTHDHMAVTYEYVKKLTTTLRHKLGPDASRILPVGSLIIAARLSEDFEFISCEAVVDTPVLYFNVVDRAVSESHPSVAAWLECWCLEAEEAIASGYFLKHPAGTQP